MADIGSLRSIANFIEYDHNWAHLAPQLRATADSIEQELVALRAERDLQANLALEYARRAVEYKQEKETLLDAIESLLRAGYLLADQSATLRAALAAVGDPEEGRDG